MNELKKIALELLEKYEDAETDSIYEMSGNISQDLKILEKEVEDYKKKIEETG